MRRILLLTALITGLLGAAHPASGQTPLRTARVCVLIAARVHCTQPAAINAAPQPITPPDQRVSHFAAAPDGSWLIYRLEDGPVYLTSLSGALRPLDTAALPPSGIRPEWASVAWSPDGVTLAYVVAGGLRAAFPTPEGAARFVEHTDRQYVNLRFSASGARLAAQDDTGGWTVFTIERANGEWTGLRRIAALDIPSDAAWLDDNSLIVAEASRVTRFNIVGDAALEPAWAVAAEGINLLSATLEGEVLAMQRPAGTTNGPIIRIAANGTLAPYSTVRVDERVQWTADGRWLVYLTAGTPILINPQNGAEDAFPISAATAFSWAAPVLIRVDTLALDGDLYFIGAAAVARPEGNATPAPVIGGRQVWQLPGDGQNGMQVYSRLPDAVTSFDLSPDRRQMVAQMGGQLIIFPALTDAEAAAQTPPPAVRRLTPTPAAPGLPGILSSRILTATSSALTAAPDWSPDGRLIAYLDADGLKVIDVPGLGIEQPAPRTLIAAEGGVTLISPRFSPDARLVLVRRTRNDQTDHLIVDVFSGNTRLLAAPLAEWAVNGLIYVRGNPGAWEIMAEIGGGEAVRARSAWPIAAIQPIGGALQPADQGVVFLRRVGWVNEGPIALQAAAATAEPDQPTLTGAPFVLPGAVFSPTGRFVASGDTISGLVIVDLQNGRKVALRSGRDLSAVRWVR